MNLMFKPQTLCLLIVDDQPQIRKAIIQILKKIGVISILEAKDGKEALDYLSEYDVDMVISDLHMHTIDGFQILKTIRERQLHSDIPFLLLSSDSAKEDIIKAVDLGTTDYLVKPFKLIELEKKIISILNKYFNPNQNTKSLRMAEKYIINQNYKEAIILINEILKKDPQNSHANYLKALILTKIEKFDESIKLIQQNILYNENFYKNYALLADIYLKLGDSIAAINALKKELEFNYKQPQRHIQIANLLLSIGDIENAIEHFRNILKENPKHREALLGIAQAYGEMGNLDKVIYYCKRIRRYYPTNTKALKILISICQQHNQIHKAEFTLKDEQKQFPNHYDTYLFLAQIYFQQNKTSQALEVLSHLLTLNPNNLSALLLKAKIHQKSKELSETIKVYKHILSNTIDSHILQEYIKLLMQIGNFKDAIEYIYKLIKLENNVSIQQLSNMALCHLHLNAYIKAYIIYSIIEQNYSLNKEQNSNYLLCKNKIHQKRILSQTKQLSKQIKNSA